MKFISAAAFSAVIMAFSSAAARADGMPETAAAAPAETACCSANWTGFYGAVGIGYSSTGTDVGYRYNDDVTTNLSTGRSVDADGVIGTVGVGYDHLVRDRFLIGLFGEYAFGEHDDRTSLPAGDFIDMTYDDTWSVGARFGLVHCCTLFYATVGYTSTDATMTTLIHDESDRLDGWFVGAGLEHYLHHNFFIRAEYRYSNYDSASTRIEFPCNCGTGFEEIDREADNHSIRLGLVYKFDRREPEPAPLK